MMPPILPGWYESLYQRIEAWRSPWPIRADCNSKPLREQLLRTLVTALREMRASWERGAVPASLVDPSHVGGDVSLGTEKTAGLEVEIPKR